MINLVMLLQGFGLVVTVVEVVEQIVLFTSNPELGNSRVAFDSNTTVRGVWLKNDGTKVYYADTQYYVYETNLSVAWDISSLSSTYTQRYDFSSLLERL